ncbi:prion-like-(Q/N-rich) domain-bearing protein 25 [Dreissena polymorpha]|uniref:prion-like-(Q/N-rich) domain-bearing protein 25 n=1 Tax=Dreissena polymorpha TaxID=45954 RepID=UPI002263E3DD|nr:prion-like-(Q/N-rich) domain-bearing protein 25 [Dreissena polymorpha]
MAGIDSGIVGVACDNNGKCINTDHNSKCNTNSRKCECSLNSTFMPRCQPIGTVGGPCKQGHCVSKNSVCDSESDFCVCATSHDLIDGACVARGAFMGLCVQHGCPLDKNAVCTDGICKCRIGSSPYYGMCIPNQANLGTCNVAAAQLCHDKNAICMDGRCMCNTADKASNIGGSCIKPGAVFGPCAELSSCPDDPNAICMDGMCMCRAGFAKVGSRCVRDGKDGGVCVGDTCPNDVNAQCNNKMCVCRTGYSRIGGICRANS